MKKLDELLKVLDAKEIKGNTDKHILQIAYDSRKCMPGSLFVAIRGAQFDGHKFINSALMAGAVAVICEEIPPNFNSTNAAFIKMDNSRAALAKLSHDWYDYPLRDMKVIGITGTNGKTTCSFLLSSVLSEAGYKTGIIGTTGIISAGSRKDATHTTPESLELAGIFHAMRRSGTEAVIMEVSSHALRQGRIEGMEFDGALFTNLTHEHLDYHGTMEEYAKAKKILFSKLKPGGKAIVNGDSEYGRLMSDTAASCGRNPGNDYKISDERLDFDSGKFMLDGKGNGIELSTKLIGSFNIENAALCASFALECGMMPEKVKAGIAKSDGAPGRMQRYKLENGALGIIDYAHTPDALEKALHSCRNVLESSGTGGRLISVFGCGGDRDRAKRPIMGRIASEIADIVVITDDNPRTENPAGIMEEISGGIADENSAKVTMIPGRANAIKKSYELSRKGDIILIAGKGHETYQIIGTEKLHFHDAEELLGASG
ncbi:MAG: UDP-N-acetylmuramoyl-L-alanyl-D-glutamate--2,6-diaminopimelate ligase [Candidatus Kapaibacterium sp.]